MKRVGVPRELWLPVDSPSSEAWEMYSEVAAEMGDAFAEGPSDASSGDGELLSPLDGECMALSAM